ncbi:polysaccharide pyruvyl transferase family protein [Levilactobacillus brevis]|uniref:polysaccharide pyruvyl transferase family protein n=1 Tax=Levilactobacillus brevis TaxID=1580 RepID=UPI001C1EB1DC|nr:polysaccharide pyruvyl transferase family protein [Levilactobacillus brevis]MBU7560108.1 polysaccharide pyruvyl transferase family protein [Levilactobacillus brevis]MCE6026259.1 polysaccharide pyruvyl transferase family protein [Levilactobacillus brevis]MCT3570304.1 polysaccharide pyruvyl transferase family protein [Levilactobacillus brevis]
MKKVLVGGYFTNNLGDDLLLKILVDHFPQVEFTIIVDAKYIDIYKQISNLRIIKKNIGFKLINRYLEAVHSHIFTKLLLSSSDAYLEIGGSIFQQRNVDSSVSMWRENIMRSKIPYFIIGSNFGPVITQNYIDKYKCFFSNINNITFRDSKSFRLFNDLDNVQLAPDAVFGLGTENIKEYKSKHKYIVVTAIDISYSNRILGPKYQTDNLLYRKKMIKLCTLILDAGYDIKIIPFSDFEQDIKIAQQIKSKISNEYEDSLEIIKYSNISQVLSLVKGASGLVSGRYHAMILGWIFRIPQFTLTYSDKMENTIHDIFPKQRNLTIKQFTENSMINSFSIDEYMNIIDSKTLISSIQKSQIHFEKFHEFLIS